MTRILLTGHGRWASGMQSGLELVAGAGSRVMAADFDGDAGRLQTVLQQALDHPDPVLVFCDLAGGTPFQMAAMACRSRGNAFLIGGASPAMVLEILPLLEQEDAATLADLAMEAGHGGIRMMKL